MLRAARNITKKARLTRRSYSTRNGDSISAVDTVFGSFDLVDVNEFRERAFIPEKPILITNRDEARSTDHSKSPWTLRSITISADARTSPPSLPAGYRWFTKPVKHSTQSTASQEHVLSHQYLSKFGNTILPYELIIDSREPSIREWVEKHSAGEGNQELASVLIQLLKISNGESFHRFSAPLSLFLQASRLSSPGLERLYIAQAQIVDLPKPLQDDLPTPRLVREAGKGDIYDANIWMGIPPTYTPLHKDPNPNLFVQLASSKLVRLFKPNTGATIFRNVQQRIGQSSSARFRGDEMMEGLEREALYEDTWGDPAPQEGFEAIVGPKDALFIPKGWWHSVKSVGTGVTASVNWWFR